MVKKEAENIKDLKKKYLSRKKKKKLSNEKKKKYINEKKGNCYVSTWDRSKVLLIAYSNLFSSKYYQFWFHFNFDIILIFIYFNSDLF